MKFNFDKFLDFKTAKRTFITISCLLCIPKLKCPKKKKRDSA